MTHPNQPMIDGLQSLVDWLKEHPQEAISEYTTLCLHIFPTNLAPVLRSDLGGVDKYVNEDWIGVRKKFGTKVEVKWLVPRQSVCERISTGKIVIDRPIMVPNGTEKVEIETFKWECPDSLLQALPSSAPK